MGVVEALEQALGLGAGEQLVRVLADDFRDMGGEHGGLIDDRVTGGDGLLAQFGGDPAGGNAEGRLPGLDAGQARRLGIGADGEDAILRHLPAGDFDAAKRDDVLARLEAQVVRDVDAGNDEAKLAGEMLAQGANAGQQLSSLVGIDQGDQGVANFEREIVEREQGVERVGLNGSGLVGSGGSGLGRGLWPRRATFAVATP